MMAKDPAEARLKFIKSISSNTGMPESDLYIFECIETTNKEVIIDEIVGAHGSGDFHS